MILEHVFSSRVVSGVLPLDNRYAPLLSLETFEDVKVNIELSFYTVCIMPYTNENIRGLMDRQKTPSSMPFWLWSL